MSQAKTIEPSLDCLPQQPMLHISLYRRLSYFKQGTFAARRVPAVDFIKTTVITKLISRSYTHFISTLRV